MINSDTDSHRTNRISRLAWFICGIITIFALVNLWVVLHDRPLNDNWIKLLNDISWNSISIVFAIVFALITSRQPQNKIGWLMVVPAIFFVLVRPVDAYIGKFTSAPTETFPSLPVVWFQNWSWLLFVIPLSLVLLLFPTGRPLSPRWRWALFYSLGLFLWMILMTTFSQYLSDPNDTWKIFNPIGFIPNDPMVYNFIGIPWIVNLCFLIVVCAVSLLLRFRRAQAEERMQIKWLLFTSAVFVIFYVSGILWQVGFSGIVEDAFSLLLILLISFFPISIAIAILRYRLWDIDLIIQKTLIYSILTTLLGVIYFGSVIVLQQVLGRISVNENSPLVIVFSTLLIAALFSPLRRRIQHVIDRRFYRQRYNAEKALADFTGMARNETDLMQLSNRLAITVQESLQPSEVSFWISNLKNKLDVK